MTTGKFGPALALAAALVCSTGAAALEPAGFAYTIDARTPIRTFVPSKAFGVAIDGGDTGESGPLLSEENRGPMRALGAANGAYRLRTELAIQAWHWSAFGRWSDPQHAQGYWTGDANRDDPAPVSYGYRLPRRGDTHDEADDNGYSRLVDGDLSTFWKSNPYLDARYTGAAQERAEWIKIDLGKAASVDTLEIAWGDPFALRYAVDYWSGSEYEGHWVPFPSGAVGEGRGGVERVRLADHPLPTRYLRLRLEASSHTAAEGGADPRDALGYAVRELRLGRMAPDGRLIDVLRHGTSVYGQSETVVSSTDPWHRASDLDVTTEQPSPLAVIKADIIGPGSLMLPVGVLYDTPENGAAEVAYFTRRGLRMSSLELGEEPDGQRVLPEDYAALYVQVGRALHGLRPDLPIGGPSLVNGFAERWMEHGPDRSWTKGFLRALDGRGASDLLSFYTVEHYPFDDLCSPPALKLAVEPKNMDTLFARFAADGLPPTMPRMLSEYGLSAFSGRQESEGPSAVFTASAGAEFLKHGGTTAFIYGATPGRPAHGEEACAGRGGMNLWETNAAGRARWPMPSYFGWRLLTQDWMTPGVGVHTLFSAQAPSSGSPPALTVHPLRGPDGRWSVLVLNGADTARSVTLTFEGGGPRRGVLADVIGYAAARYQWSAKVDRPLRDDPPVVGRASWDRPILVPPFSVTVVRER